MIVPFWSWNLSDTTHVRPHTKFQLVWAINTVFTRGGHNVPPPSLKCVAGTPSLLGLNNSEQIGNIDQFFSVLTYILSSSLYFVLVKFGESDYLWII